MVELLYGVIIGLILINIVLIINFNRFIKATKDLLKASEEQGTIIDDIYVNIDMIFNKLGIKHYKKK